jgi:hypothetical protein
VLAFCFLLETTNLTRLQVYALELGSHFCWGRSLFTSASWAKIARLASLPEFNIQLIFQNKKQRQKRRCCYLFLNKECDAVEF